MAGGVVEGVGLDEAAVTADQPFPWLQAVVGEDRANLVVGSGVHVDADGLLCCRAQALAEIDGSHLGELPERSAGSGCGQ